VSESRPASESLEGVVRRVVYAAPDGGFAVLRLEVEGRPLPVTVLGPFAEAVTGELMRLEGVWERHAVHGEQFRAQRVIVEVPRTPNGVRRYLQTLKGIGPALAERLLTSFGVEALEVLETEPWRSAQVRGMTKKRAAAVALEAAARRHEREVMVFLQGLGVSLAYAARIRKVYGSDAVQRVRDNPYRLARDIPGIGFLLADRIARSLGIEANSPLRLQAGVLHLVTSFVDEGHTFAPIEELGARTTEALATTADAVAGAVSQLIDEGALVREGEAIYPTWLHRAETEAAQRVLALLAAPPPSLVTDAALPAAAKQAQLMAGLSVGQRAAVRLSQEARVLVLTGGPGTGKTTVVKAVVGAWEVAKKRVLLAAPTGRAAKRLQEATGHAAHTVHRTLEWGRPSGQPGKSPFGRGPDHPLEVDLLVVDEASMLDTVLFRALVEAVPLGASLMLVGDIDQLPSVGAGQVLADVIGSGVIPVARLTEIFRQASGSSITDNAYRILSGEVPVGNLRAAEGAAGGDFYFISVEDPERLRELVVRLCQERIPEAFGLDPRRDIQVLSPMHRGPAGTEELNRALQEALNPTGQALDAGRAGLRVGDKVMQVRNDYDRDVFNGDVGQVISAQVADGEDEDLRLQVDFDGRSVTYVDDEIDQLELAYAVSVHKSQGSEYPAVVLALHTQHWLLLRRNLLYTAVTRGKRLVVIVGSERALRRAVAEVADSTRHTGLRQRLQQQRAVH